MRVDPGIAMIEFGTRPRASFDGTHGLSEQQGDLLGDGGPSAEVGDVQDVFAFGDNQLQHALAQQLASRGDRDGTDAGDLAELAVACLAALQGLEIDP